MAGLNTYPYSNLEVGMAIAREPRSATQAMGLGGLAPTTADIAGLREQSLSSMYQMGQEAIAELRQPPAPQNAIAYSPSTQKYWVNSALVDATSPMELAQSGSLFNQPARPAPTDIATDWQPTSKEAIAQRVANLRQPRGVLANIGLGLTSDLPETTIGGLGRTLELAGATEFGPAIAGVAERAFGQSKAEQERDALIRQSNSIWSNLTDAIARGAPSTIPAVLAGIGGFAVGGPVGAGLAAAATIFPQELKGFYDSAVKNGYNVNDPAVQADMLKSATGTTVLQSLMPAMAGKGFSQFFRNAAQQAGEQAAATALTRTARVGAVAGEAAKEGLTEGVAEAVSQLAQSAVFDPEFRRQLNASDIKALAPYVAEKYGEDALLAFGAGAFLGAGFGGAAKYIETRPVDLTQREEPAAEAAPGEAPLALPPPALQLGYRPSTGFTQQPPEVIITPAPVGEAPAAPLGLPAPETPLALAPPVAAGTPALPAPAGYVSPGGRIPEVLPMGGTIEPLIPPVTEGQFELFPGIPQQQVPPGMQLLQRGAPPAPAGEQIEMTLTGQAPYLRRGFASQAERAAAMEAAMPTPAPEGPMAPALQRLLRGQAFTQAEAQRAAQMEGAPTAAETAAPAMQAQVAETMPAAFDTEAAVTGTNKIQDDARRKTVNMVNALTEEQQTSLLDKLFDNDINKFYESVRSARGQATLRKQMAQAAGVEQTTFEQARATPTPQETPSAPQVRQVQQGRLRKRPRDGGQVAGEGVDRNVPTQVQEGGGQAGGRNRLVQGRAQPQEVVPAPAPAVEEAAAPLPLEVAAEAAPSVQPAAAPVVEARAPASSEPTVPVSDAQEVDDVIVSLNTSDPGSTDFIDSLATLIAISRDPTNKAARAKARDYLENEFDDADRMSLDYLDAEFIAKTGSRAPSDDPRVMNVHLGTLNELIAQVERGVPLTPNQRNQAIRAWNAVKASDPVYGTYRMADIIKPSNPNYMVFPRGGYSLNSWNTVTGASNLDGQPIRPMSMQGIRQAVSKFLSGLAIKPNLQVFANQADLKARNPDLYARAAAAREAGDFDSADAAGYSFGDGNVLIFTDRIANEDHLNFVLAHETLGHFGLRGIMPGPKFDALMERLYNDNIRIRNAVDAAMGARGMNKAEAVEEYLSDYAAILDTSLVAKVWNGIKGFLNKLGVKFGDEATRYFLDQARRYVREGKAGVTFDAAAVAGRLQDIESGNYTGRFSPTSMRSENEQFADNIRFTGAWTTDPMAAIAAARSYGINTREGWDKFKARFLSLTNFRALQNPGLEAFESLLDETRQINSSILVRYKEALATLYNAPTVHKNNVSQLLIRGRDIAVNRMRTNKDLGAEPLYSISAKGEVVANDAAIERLVKRGMLSFDEAKNGVTYKVDTLGADGKVVTTEKRFAGIKSLTQAQYDDYVKSRRAIADVELQLLRAKYVNFLGDEKVSKKAIRRLIKGNNLTPADSKFVDTIVQKFKSLYTEGITTDVRGYPVLSKDAVIRSNEFIAAVNAALIGDRADRNDAVKAFFDNQKQADDFVAKLADFKGRRVDIDDSNRFLLQNEVKKIVLSDLSMGDEEKRAKRSIAAGYVPIIREGAFEMRVEARIGGKQVSLTPEHQQLLVYSQFSGANAAQSAARDFNKQFGNQEFETLVRQDDGTYATKKIKLVATFGDSLDAVASDPALNLEEFVHGLRLFGINPTPDVMANIIVTLTRTGEALRRKLEFSGTPGYDINSGVYAMSRHIEQRASTIAKTLTRPQMRELMNRKSDSSDLWFGDRSGVINAKKAFDAATTPEEKAYAKRVLDKKLFQFRQTNPEAAGWDGSADTFAQFDQGVDLERGNRFYNEASRTMDFLENNKNVTESDFGSSKYASILRGFTSVFQLGGSIAQGVMNMISPYTNWMPYMASYNQKNAFGGGFSLGKVNAAYHLALKQVGLNGITNAALNTAEFYDSLIGNKLKLQQYGLQEHEARFLAREIREGKLIPAQSNALIATARGLATNKYMLKFMDAYMAPFNLTEQASRRAAGLAAYRLEYERLRTAGVKEELEERAREFAVKSLDLTLGEYSVLNRPAAWRDGVTSFLYMYKIYPTTTVQLLRNLSRPGQIGMLSAMWLLAGAAGLPFAEDMEDLVDTLAQQLGFKSGSIRVEVAKLIDSILPGMSPLVLKGAVHTYLGIPGDLGSRLAQGDLIPATGILLAGAKPLEEIKDLIGPMPSMALGMATTAADLIRVPFSENKSLEDVARASPVTLLRMLGDASAYLNTGAIVDRRGSVVSQDMSAGAVIARLMGFYPTAAADQYEMIKYTKRIADYQKEATTGFRQAWIKAKLRGDNATARAIESNVDEWNSTLKGTALEIKKFTANSQRALNEAKRSASERALRAAPQAARRELDQLPGLLID